LPKISTKSLARRQKRELEFPLRTQALTLASASSNRILFPRVTGEQESTSEITTVLGTMKESRVDDVRKILEPMFMLFDFQQFNAEIYEEIVRNFERGVVR
jgi:hypothetical protein